MATTSDASSPSSGLGSLYDEASSHTDYDSEPQTPIDPRQKIHADAASKPSTLLAENPFASNESRLLFEAIDKLRSHGAGQVLDLPQLVIVGKQSVGKSSLLESLTDIPFPVDDELCTRFATRVISRRTAPNTLDMINVSIEEGDVDPFGDSAGQTGHLEPPRDQKSMTAEYFRDLMKKASVAMGISDGKNRSGKNFSSKVLKIELSGPGRSHFGILDLPGIFSAETGPITSDEREGVDRMVIAYMKRRENIIVCVVDAVDNLANHRILSLANDYAEDNRIVGVITKCDMTDNPARVVSTVQNSEGITGKPLQHGWFVVQNRGHRDDRSSFDREKAERLRFSKEPWLDIEEKRRGTANLKLFLSNLLCRSIRESFPAMLKTVQARLEQERKALNALGKPRKSLALQKSYLSDIALRFQTLAGYALHEPQNLPSVDTKLRGKADRAKSGFAEELRHRGHLYAFVPISETEATSGRSNQVNEDTVLLGNGESGRNRTLYDEIRTQIRENKSQELQGMINPAVLKPLFRQQASRWPAIAEQHLENLAGLTEDAVLCILKVVCEELGVAEYLQEELEQIVLDFTKTARSRAMNKLEKYRLEDRSLPLYTDNPAFDENVKKAQLSRFKAALKRYAKKNQPKNFMMSLAPQNPASIETIPGVWKNWTIISPESLGALFEEMHAHSEKNTEDEIHDLLKAYYEVVREDYITYINRHVAEPFLQDEDGPVKGLSTTYINTLSEERVEELGAEQESTVKKRNILEASIKRLEDAEKIARDAFRKTKAVG